MHVKYEKLRGISIIEAHVVTSWMCGERISVNWPKENGCMLRLASAMQTTNDWRPFKFLFCLEWETFDQHLWDQRGEWGGDDLAFLMALTLDCRSVGANIFKPQKKRRGSSGLNHSANMFTVFFS